LNAIFEQSGGDLRSGSDTGIVDITPSNVNVDYDYLKVYGIKLKQGRDFSKTHASDKGKSFIIFGCCWCGLRILPFEFQSTLWHSCSAVSYHTLRSARANPVDAQRYE
jgi:hypothetical protein